MFGAPPSLLSAYTTPTLRRTVSYPLSAQPRWQLRAVENVEALHMLSLLPVRRGALLQMW